MTTRLDAAKDAYADGRINLDELEVLTEYLLASGDGDRWAPDGYGGYPDSLDLRHARDELRRIRVGR